MKFPYWLQSVFILIFLSGTQFKALSQSDPEFPKGFIMYAKLHSGMVTDFSSNPDLYTEGIQLAPQITVTPHLLRAGAIADGFYTSKKIQAAFGPSLSLKNQDFQCHKYIRSNIF